MLPLIAFMQFYTRVWPWLSAHKNNVKLYWILQFLNFTFSWN